MKYCTQWNNQLTYPIEELIIQFKPEPQKLIKFLNNRLEQTIILKFENIKNFQTEGLPILKGFKANSEKYPQNFKVLFNQFDMNEELLNELKELNIPYFYAAAADSWGSLRGLLALGVSDIYVTLPLLFELKDVAYLAHQAGVNIRAVPNLAFSAWKGTPSYRCFWVRPEDVTAYEPYIDTFEFYNDGTSRTNPNVLYEIYHKQQKWSGELDEIIMGLPDKIDSRFLVPEFPIKRTNCGLKCEKNLDKCKVCKAFIELSEVLKSYKIEPRQYLDRKKSVENAQKVKEQMEENLDIQKND